MKRTFIDSGVLIAAVRGTPPVATEALKILNDPDREYASSAFVRLEVLPKCIYHKKKNEVDFYQAFFDAVAHWASDLNTLVEEAYKEATTFGLDAVDAMHVAVAMS